MNRKRIIYIFVLSVVIILIIAAFFILSRKNPDPDNIDMRSSLGSSKNAAPGDATADYRTQAAGVTVENAVKNMEIVTNPVENKPDINPASNMNPVRKVRTNPFE